MKIVIMGPQGSGKSTQTELLAKKLKLPRIQTGQIYRDFIKQDSKTAKKVKNLIEKGILVDDKTTLKLLNDALSKTGKAFVLEGFPRTIKQVEMSDLKIDRAVYIHISDAESKKRLFLRKRKDDTPEVIEERLRLYHQETEPVLDYYRKQGKLVEINGEQSIEKVAEEIIEKLSLN